MKADWFSVPVALSHSLLITLVLLLGIGITTACGSGGATPTLPKLSGNTSVTVLLSSSANAQVTSFNVALESLSLTSQSGKTVNLLSSQQPAEFMHLNGQIEPLAAVTIPQDIYTSASIKLSRAVFVCVGQVPGGGLGISNYSIIDQGPIVNLGSPITVTGSSMTLLLNLQGPKSAVLSSCWTSPAFQGFSMTPTFDLTPTNSASGEVRGLKGQVASVESAGSILTITVAGGPFGTRTLSVRSNTATMFQGAAGASALSAGMFLDVDGAIQSDGSLLGTRIALEDSSAINESSGPVMFVDTIVPDLELFGRTELGVLTEDPVGHSGVYLPFPYFDHSNAIFRTSSQFTNLQNLPFVPSFNSSSIVAGQNVDVTSNQFSTVGGVYTPASTITLAPQTINGMVVASQQVGAFTDYTVSLASYDLFSTLAVQQGQTTLLNNPTQVEVYVDSSTATLNTQALAVGSTPRFYGLVFNDNGTLRMDCAQVNDGASVAGGP
jgi:hypothetical protein